MKSAEISKKEAEAQELEDGVAELKNSVAQWKKETETATAFRAKEKAENKAGIREMTDTISAVKRALKALEDAKKSQEKAASKTSLSQEKAEAILAEEDVAAVKSEVEAVSLMQLSQEHQASILSLLPADIEAAVASLLQLPEAETPNGPASSGLEFRSSGAVEMLKDLKNEAEEQRFKAEQEETAAQRSHDVLMQQLETNVKRAEDAISEKRSAAAECKRHATSLKSDLTIAQDRVTADTAHIQETRSDCMEKAVEYDKSQATREEEIKALGLANQILKSDQVNGAEDKHIAVLLQLRSSHSSTSLAQHFRGSTKGMEVQKRLVSLLLQRAEKTGSGRLALVARHAEEAWKPGSHDRLVKIIHDMIFKLQAELHNMVEQKALCDREMATNKFTRETKAAAVEELRSTVEQNDAEFKNLEFELKDLYAAVNKTRVQLARATEIREKEKAKNAQAIKDAQDAQVATTRAKEVLENFYSGQASFLQQQNGMEAAMEQAAKGPFGTSAGIIAMIEVIISDFAKLEAETSENEDTSEDKYKRFSAETTQDIKVMDVEIHHKEERQSELTTETADARKELELTKEELEAALLYFEELKPMCVNTNPGYEERQEKRKSEISAMRDALKLLNDEPL
eukprot:TRINITY_DN30803_c0_g1_i1.p1 TRINITY_DN30803_c0_g1~~TRINITY_DN30803_c0_g1_i1.p1  ORF type:complete len:629 (-),score=225.94 TRINITY_DN30803_c0_g1_i1:52-1938(-)